MPAQNKLQVIAVTALSAYLVEFLQKPCMRNIARNACLLNTAWPLLQNILRGTHFISLQALGFSPLWNNIQAHRLALLSRTVVFLVKGYF